MAHAWHENEDTRRFSVESEDHALSLGLRKLSKKSNRIRSESHFGSLGSNEKFFDNPNKTNFLNLPFQLQSDSKNKQHHLGTRKSHYIQ